MDTKYRITKNVIYNFLGQFVLLALGLITTPIIISSLGNTVYGIFAVTVALLGYFSILDLGLGVSVVKYISEYSAKNDRDNLKKVLGTALSTFIILGLFGMLVIFATTGVLVGSLLKIPSEFVPLAISVFYISAVSFLINMILTVFNAVPIALQRMDITNSRNILFGILNSVGIITILYFGGGLFEIVLWSSAVSILASLVFLFIIKRLIKPVTISLNFDSVIFKQLIKFGGYKFLSNIGGQVVFQLDKIIIGFFHPIALVTFYATPVLLTQKGFTLILNITSAVFPAMSESLAQNNLDRTRHLYFKMAKFITLITLPVMAIFFIFAPQILSLWLGPEFAEKSSLSLRILSLAYFIAALSAPGVVAADAFGKPQISALFAVISATINLVAAFILIPKMGIEGAAYALLINFVAQVPVFLYIVHKKLVKVETSEYLKKSLFKPLIAGVVAGLMVIPLINIFNVPLVMLLLGTTVYGASYLAINWFIGTFDSDDKKTINFLTRKVLRLKV